MFRYRQQDFLFLIIEFSDGKLKQKVFFHSVVVLMASARPPVVACLLLASRPWHYICFKVLNHFPAKFCRIKNHSSLRLLCAEIFPRQLSLLVDCRTYARTSMYSELSWKHPKLFQTLRWTDFLLVILLGLESQIKIFGEAPPHSTAS